MISFCPKIIGSENRSEMVGPGAWALLRHTGTLQHWYPGISITLVAENKFLKVGASKKCVLKNPIVSDRPSKSTTPRFYVQYFLSITGKSQ